MLDFLTQIFQYVLDLKWQSTPALLPGKSHGWRTLIGYSPRGREESDTTEPLHFHFHISVQFSSVAQSCPTLRDPMNHSTPGLPVHHHLDICYYSRYLQMKFFLFFKKNLSPYPESILMI